MACCTSSKVSLLSYKTLKVENLKSDQILFAHKDYFLMPGHKYRSNTGYNSVPAISVDLLAITNEYNEDRGHL